MLTYTGLGHKIAMTLLFAVGTLQIFIFNKRWTFEYRSRHRSSFTRNVFIFSAAYLLNLMVLLIFADRWGWQHQWVQGLMIFVIGTIPFSFNNIGYSHPDNDLSQGPSIHEHPF